jgi:predicted nuclease of predicted toxin-antitoxin system
VKALLDMPVSASLLSVLEARGHEGVHAHQLGLDRAPDEDLLALARREQRVVITADLDFPRMLALSAAEGPGLILFRAARQWMCESSTASLRKYLRNESMRWHIPIRTTKP